MRYSVRALFVATAVASILCAFAFGRVVPQMNAVQAIRAVDATASHCSSDGTWIEVSPSFADNFAKTVTRVDLIFDGLEADNLQVLFPMLQRFPKLKELHLPAWMNEEFINRIHSLKGRRQNFKIVFDVPYPA